MTLLSALPSEYESVTQTYLQITTLSSFKFSNIQEGVLAEHACQLNKGYKQIQKLSNVECKGDNPKWKPCNNKDKQKGQKDQQSRR